MNANAQNDSPEMIRKQMEATKRQLAEKLEALRGEIVDTVQTTENAVTATVGAFQETVETVTDEFHDAVQSVRHAFDLSRHVDKHPWFVIGSAALIGYLGAEFLSNQTRKADSSGTLPIVGANAVPQLPRNPVACAALTSAPNTSFATQLRDAAIGSVIALIPEITARIVPQVVDHLAKKWVEQQQHIIANHEVVKQNQPPSDESPSLRIAASEPD